MYPACGVLSRCAVVPTGRISEPVADVITCKPTLPAVAVVAPVPPLATGTALYKPTEALI